VPRPLLQHPRSLPDRQPDPRRRLAILAGQWHFTIPRHGSPLQGGAPRHAAVITPGASREALQYWPLSAALHPWS
jgi:hypothetical protein